MTTTRRLTRYETGIRHFFGKRYLWLLSPEGRHGLHKVDDRGSDEGMEALLEKQKGQAE